MELNNRQKQIIKIVQEEEPISGDVIAKKLGLTRATIRSDLAVLTMLNLLDAKPKVGYSFVKLTPAPQLSQLAHQLFGTTVKEIMQSPYLIEQNITVKEGISFLFLYDVGSLSVVDEQENLVGVISRKDFLRGAMGGEHNLHFPVAMIMTRTPNLIVSYPEETLLDVAQKIMKYEIDSLPVVESQTSNRVIGRISKTTITYFFAKIGAEFQQNPNKK